MQTTWFAIALVFLILSMGGLVTAAVLCSCRQRVPTPRHPHNAHNAQSHPPVSFPCESQKTTLTRTRSIRVVVAVVATTRSRCNLATVSQLVFFVVLLCVYYITSKHGENFFVLATGCVMSFTPYNCTPVIRSSTRAYKNNFISRMIDVNCCC